jgi:predicted ferric reductase
MFDKHKHTHRCIGIKSLFVAFAGYYCDPNPKQLAIMKLLWLITNMPARRLDERFACQTKYKTTDAVFQDVALIRFLLDEINYDFFEIGSPLMQLIYAYSILHITQLRKGF